MLKNLLLLALIIFLNACSTPPAPDKPLLAETTEREGLLELLIDKPARLLQPTPVELNLAREQYYQQQDWQSFIALTERLWASYSEEKQATLLKDTLSKLLLLEPEIIEQLAQSADQSLQSWAWLAQTQHTKGFKQKRELEDLSQIAQNISFNPQLIDILIADTNQLLSPPEHIAVLLPLSGRLEIIGKQIRGGILKHYWHAQSQKKLVFYDTNQSDGVVSLYQTALNNGAERIIGPLTREEIKLINEIAGPEVIALNRLEQPSNLFQLSLRSLTETNQIVTHLINQCFEHVAIISSNLSTDSQMANELQTDWAERQKFKLIHHRYPHNSNNLRAEMNQVLNLQHSQGRAGFLSRVIGQTIEHEPRSRQDLQALVLIGDEQRLAVLQPQMDFHQIEIPLIGSSLLTPSQLAQAPLNRDLKNIQFPTHPASFTVSPLTNTLEALGWDGFLLANTVHKLEKGMYIHGALGRHVMCENNLINTQLDWAQYQEHGKLVSVRQPPANNFYWTKAAKPLSNPELIRQKLLDEIIKFNLDEVHVNFKQ